MSVEIGERLVRMVFDNKKFEAGIKESTESLEKFDKSLDKFFKGNHDANQLENAIEGIADATDEAGQHFTMLDAAGTAALLSLARTAGSVASEIAGKLAKFTIDFEMGNAMQGMNKYESLIESTQKIVNSTRQTVNGQLESQESAMSRVTPVLEKFQKYADETSYSMGQMTNALGQFTGAGIELEKSSKAIMGIANWAAMSGVSASSNDAARAFYNMSQAMGRGAMLYEDWKTFQMIGMGTPEFKKMAIETAEEMHKLEKVSDGVWKVVGDNSKKGAEVTVENFTDALSKRWLDSNVLTELLGKYGTGFWDKNGKQIYDDTLGSRSFLAAQEAKTWKDAIEAVYETASTGWANTWTYIYGNYIEAKKLWTNLAEALINVVATVGDIRNGIAQIFHDSGGQQWLVDMSEKLKTVTSDFYDFATAVAAALGLIPEESKDATKSVVELNGAAAELSESAKKNAEAVRGMIDTGTVKMKQPTKDTFNALADAWDDLDKYLNEGNVDADVLAEKMEKINQLTHKAAQTNGLMRNKKNALLGMMGENSDEGKASEWFRKIRESIIVTQELKEAEEAASEGTGEPTKAELLAERIRPILENVKSIKRIWDAIAQAGTDNFDKIVGILGLLGDRFLTVTTYLSSFIPKLGEFLNENNRLSNAVGFVLDRINSLVEWGNKIKTIFTTLKGAVFGGILDFLGSAEFADFKKRRIDPLIMALDGVVEVVSQIIGLSIDDVLKNVVLYSEKIRQSISGFLASLTKNEWLNSSFGKLMSFLVNDVTGALIDFRNDILNLGLFPTLIKYTTRAQEKIDEFVTNSTAKLLSFFVSPKKYVKEWGENLQNGMIKGLSGIFAPGGALSKGTSLLTDKLGGLSSYFGKMQRKYRNEPEIFQFFGNAKTKVDGVTKKLREFNKAIEKGIVKQKIDKAFGDLGARFTKLRQTITGFVKDPKASFANIGKNLVDTLLSPKKSIEKWGKSLERGLQTKLATLASKDGPLAKGASAVSGRLGGISEYFDNLSKKFKDNPELSKFFGETKVKVDALNKRIKDFGELVKTGVISEKIRNGVLRLKAGFDNLKTSVSNFIKDPKASFVKLGQNLKTGLTNAFKKDGIVSSGMEFLSSKFSSLKTYFENLKESFKENPTAVKIFDWLAAKVDWLSNKFASFKNSIDTGGFMAGVTEKLDGVKKKLEELGVLSVFDTIRQKFESLMEIFDKFKEKLAFYSRFTENPFKAIGDALSRTLSDIFPNLFDLKPFREKDLGDNFNQKTIIRAVLKPIDEIFESIKSAIAEKFSLSNLFGKIGEGGDASESLADKILGFLGLGGNQEQTITETLESGFGDLIQKIFGIQSAAAEEIEGFESNPLVKQDSKKGFFASLGDYLSAGLTNLSDVFKQFKPIADAFSTGSMFLSIKSMMSDLAMITGGKRQGGTIREVAKVIQNIALAIGTLVVALIVLSLVPIDTVRENLITIGVFIAALSGLGVILTVLKADIGTMILKIGQGILSLAISMLLLSAAIAVLAAMSWDTFWAGMQKVALMIAGLGIAMYFLSKNFQTSETMKGKILGDSIMAMAKAINSLLISVVTLGALPFNNLVKGLVATGLLLTGLSVALIAISRFSEGEALAKSAKSIEAVGKAIQAITLSLVVLGNMAPDKLLRGGIAIAGMIVGIIAALKVADKLSKDFNPMSLIVVAGAISVMALAFAGAMAMVQNMSWEQMAAFSAGLVGVMVGFAAACKIISTIPTGGAISGGLGVAAIIGIITGVIAIAGALNELTKGNFAKLLESGGEVLEKVGQAIGKAIGGIVGGIGEGVSDSLPAIGSNLSSFYYTAEPFLTMLQTFNSENASGFVKFLKDLAVQLGIVKFTGLDSTLGNLAGNMRTWVNLTKGMNGGLKDSKAAATMSNHIATIVKNLGGEGGSKVASMALVGLWIGRIGAALELYGKNIQSIPELSAQEALDKADVVAKFVQYIIDHIDGSAFAESIEGFPSESNIGVFALDLVALAGAVETFASKSQDITEEKLKGGFLVLDYMARLQEKLPATEKTLGWFTSKKQTLGDFASGINQLTGAMSYFVTEANAIKDDKKLETAKSLLDYFAVTLEPSLTNLSSTWERIFGGGLFSGHAGEYKQDLGDFGSNIGQLGAGLNTFVRAINGGADGSTGIDQGKVDIAIGALDALQKIENALPTTGGLFQLINGGKSLATFGKELPDVGEGLHGLFSAFKMEDGTVDVPTEEEIKQITGALGALSDINSALSKDNEGFSAFERLLGLDNLGNLGDFSSTLPNVGKNIVAFGQGFKDAPEDTETSASRAAQIISTFSAAAEGLPDTSGESGLKKFLGLSSIKDIKAFATNFPVIGTNIKRFARIAKNVTDEDKTNADRAASIINAISSAAANLPDTSGESGLKKFLGLSSLTDIKLFSDTLPNLADNIVKFSDAFTGKEINVQAATDGASVLSSFANAANNLPEDAAGPISRFLGLTTLGDIGTFSGNLPTIAQNIIAFAREFNGEAIDQDTVNNAAGMISLFSEIAKALPENQNVLDKIFSGDQTLTGFTGQFATIAGDLQTFQSKTSGVNFVSANAAVALLTNLANLATTLSDSKGWEDGLANMNAFLKSIIGSDDFTFNLGFVAGSIVTEICENINNETNRLAFTDALNNLFTIDPNMLTDVTPTIRPVLDLSGFDATNQLGTLFETSGLSTQISSAITFESIGLTPISEKLQSCSDKLSTVCQVLNHYGTVIDGDLATVDSSVGQVATAIGSIDIVLDTGAIAGQVNYLLGKE